MGKLIPLSLSLLLALVGTQASFAQHVSITGIDQSVKPGDNFFMFVNKTWYDSVEIPSTQTGVGSYSFMNFPQRVRMQGILDSVSAAKNPKGSIEQKVGDFYTSGLDISTINKRGYEPIKPLLKSIDGIKDVASLMKFVTEQQKFSNFSIIGLRVGPDMKNSAINIINLGQTGIGLPERDYYFKTDSSTIGIQKAYITYVTTLLKLSGTKASGAAKMASAAYAIEKELAASHKTNIERRNVQANYNKMSLATIATKQPNIGWMAYFNGLGVKIDSLNVQQPAYYERLNALLGSVSIADWKAYLKAKSLIIYADFLSKDFTSAAFEYSKILTGQSIQKPRGEEITDAVDKSA